MKWKTDKLGEIVRLINGRAYLQPELFDSGKYRIVRVGNLSGGEKWFYSDMELSEDKYCDKGDLLYAWACNFGPYIWKESKTIYHYHIWKMVEDKSKVDKIFLYYYLKYLTPLWLGNVNGSVMVHITKGTMEKFEINLPPLDEQKRIAAILSSLDAKIENNNRINANLEAQAQALYKSWFVDFEPFGGSMPEDWREGKLGELAVFRRGKGILGKDVRSGVVPVVAGGLEPAYYHDTANTKAPVITISASGANAGYMRMYNEDVWASDCSFIDSNNYNIYWVYCFLSLNSRLLRHAQTGAVQPHVKPSDVNDFDVVVPPQNIIADFQALVKPLFDTIATNQRENTRLATLRDTLLPKLMKGEAIV